MFEGSIAAGLAALTFASPVLQLKLEDWNNEKRAPITATMRQRGNDVLVRIPRAGASMQGRLYREGCDSAYNEGPPTQGNERILTIFASFGVVPDRGATYVLPLTTIRTVRRRAHSLVLFSGAIVAGRFYCADL